MRPYLPRSLERTFDPAAIPSNRRDAVDQRQSLPVMGHAGSVAFAACLFAMLGLTLATTAARAAAAGDAFRVRPLTFATATLTAKGEGPARCTTPNCARRELDSGATVRLTGEFGSFTGKVARWQADSLSGFTSFPDSSSPKPVGALHWSQVQRVDERVGHAGRDAVWGALLGGALGLAIPWIVYANGDPHAEIVPGVGGVVVGAFVGAFVGGVIGSGSFHWEYVYQRP